MKVSLAPIPRGDETSTLIIRDLSKDDLKHLYIRVSLMNADVVQAMGTGFGDKTLPDTSFGCEFAEALAKADPWAKSAEKKKRTVDIDVTLRVVVDDWVRYVAVNQDMAILAHSDRPTKSPLEARWIPAPSGSTYTYSPEYGAPYSAVNWADTLTEVESKD